LCNHIILALLVPTHECKDVKQLGLRSVVTGDVRQMHQSPENAGALFQVASQFNLLEMVSPTVTPEDGVTRYQHDAPPAPHPSRLARFAHSRLRTTARCAIAAGAATIYRNHFAPVGGGSRSPDCALLRNPGKRWSPLG